MILTELSAPPSTAVPVRALAEHLRLGSGFADDGSQDQLLELYLRSAMAAIEARRRPRSPSSSPTPTSCWAAN